jgi:hypothetical protein
LIFLSSTARIAHSATGTLYVLPVRMSFMSSALPEGDAAGGLAELLAEAGAAGLVLFFLGAAGRAVEPVFGILFSS